MAGRVTVAGKVLSMPCAPKSYTQASRQASTKPSASSTSSNASTSPHTAAAEFGGRELQFREHGQDARWLGVAESAVSSARALFPGRRYGSAAAPPRSTAPVFDAASFYARAVGCKLEAGIIVRLAAARSRQRKGRARRPFLIRPLRLNAARPGGSKDAPAPRPSQVRVCRRPCPYGRRGDASPWADRARGLP